MRHFVVQCSAALPADCRAYKVKDITSIQVIENQAVSFQNKFLVLRPGLKITVKPCSGSVTTILVAMPDAAEFAAKLNELTASSKHKNKQISEQAN